jgi:subtilase family serine protease
MSNRWPLAVLAAGLALSSTVVFSSPSRAQQAAPAGLAVLTASASPALPAHSVALGSVSSSTTVHLDVALKLADATAVTSLVASLSDRASANFRHFLGPGQFGRRFGPSLTEVAAVEAVLRSDGLDPGPVTSNHLMIPVTAKARQVERALHVNLLRYRLASGRTVFTPSSPPSIAAAVYPDIEGVVGLDDIVQAHSMLVQSKAAPGNLRRSSAVLEPRSAGPKPCSDAIKAAEASSGSRTADVLASYYGMTPLYDLGDFGQGVHIAVAEFEPNLPSDIAGYQSCYGTNTAVNYVAVDGGPGTGSGQGEAVLDIEDIIGFAPQATIDVYQGATTATGPTANDILDVYSAIVNKESDQIVSTGWGMCEPDTVAGGGGAAFLSAEQDLFAQAATQGQTVFAAAGDTGSADCYLDAGTSDGDAPTVDDPASQPNVIAVGGTSIGSSSESVWNDPSGAGGGGVSSEWCMPSYQAQSTTAGKSTIPGLINADSVLAPAALQGVGCPAGSYMRQVPDVSADADPATGFVVYRTPPNPSGSAAVWVGGDGGTSASAPLWAAVAALVDASPFCGDYASVDVAPKGALAEDATGLFDESLYYLANTQYYTFGLFDVTKGNNYFARAGDSVNTKKLYPATTGYDMASGLGTPTVGYLGNFFPGLAALTCALTGTKLTKTKIAHVVPDLGPSSHSTKVTIFGTGFLPIAGGDLLKVGSKWVTVSCASNTSCTGSLPATKPGTLELTMVVEDLTASASSASDQFSFAGVPTVTRVRPLLGPERSGTKVTIRGTEFFGKVKVFFGSRRATHVHVISSSKIIAWAPSGTGTVSVYVSTIGGKTKKTPVGKFAYTPTKQKKKVR